MTAGGGGSGQHHIVAFSHASQLTREPPESVHLGMPPSSR
jgi:hypothetical protein